MLRDIKSRDVSSYSERHSDWNRLTKRRYIQCFYELRNSILDTIVIDLHILGLTLLAFMAEDVDFSLLILGRKKT